jgi:hypothetical protein
MRVSASGGEPELVVARDRSERLEPQVIDERGTILFSLTNEQIAGRWDQAQIVVQPLTAPTHRRRAAAPRVCRQVTSYAVGGRCSPFADAAQARVVVRRRSSRTSRVGARANAFTAQYAVSNSGSLAYFRLVE